MPAIELQPRFLVRLNADEFRVVSLALAQKLSTGDLEMAKRLNLQLCNQRVAAIEDMLKVAERARHYANDIANPGGILDPHYGEEPQNKNE